jgi:DNA repair protein RadD
MPLRDYQQRSVDETWSLLRSNREARPVIELPTGAGKSWVLAQLATDAVEKWDARVLVVTHVKELIEQNAEKLHLVNGSLDVGVYSAGLGRRDTEHAVIVAGVQSIYKRAPDISGTKPFNLVIIDEAHLIPESGDGMYRQLLADLLTINPRTRIVGLTATPYRLSSGTIIGEGKPFNCVSYRQPVLDLIEAGWLARPTSKRATRPVETSDLPIRNGEFRSTEMQGRFMDVFVESGNEFLTATFDRRSVLVFCSGVEHATNLHEWIISIGHTAEVVLGETPPEDRARILDEFRQGRIKYLLSVDVLTTGFDAPNIDAIILLRSTMSPGLYYQMIGRGLRTTETKDSFLVMDFGGNVERHGPIDRLKPSREPRSSEAGSPSEPPVKACPQCNTFTLAQTRVCDECGHEFKFKPAHDPNATDAAVLSVDAAVTFENRDVTDIEYRVHEKRNAGPGTPRTLRVIYTCGYYQVSEWICVEHESGSFAHRKALKWWQNRCRYPMPDDADEALRIADLGGLMLPEWIRIKSVAGDEWDRVEGYFFGLGAEMPQVETLEQVYGEAMNHG